MQTHFTYLFAMDTPSYVFIRPMILVSLECIGFCQRNGTNLVLMQSMVFKIQLFLIYTFQKVVALHVLHEGRKYSYRCTVMLARNCTLCPQQKNNNTPWSLRVTSPIFQLHPSMNIKIAVSNSAEILQVVALEKKNTSLSLRVTFPIFQLHPSMNIKIAMSCQFSNSAEILQVVALVKKQGVA